MKRIQYLCSFFSTREAEFPKLRTFAKRNSRRGARLGVCLWVGLFAVFALPAQPRQACKSDVERFCSKIQPGRARIKACLKEHESELSASCKEQLARWKEVKRSCAADREKYCGGKRGPQLKQCIKANRNRFSESCKAAVRKARGE